MAISNLNKERLNRMNRVASRSQLGSVIQTVENNVSSGASDIVANAAAIGVNALAIAANVTALNGKSIVACEQATTVGGAAAEAIAVVGALSTDKVFVQLVDQGTAVVSVVKAECAADVVNVTFSADPGNDAIVNVLVLR